MAVPSRGSHPTVPSRGSHPRGPVPWCPPSLLTGAAEQRQEQRQERDGAGAHVRRRPLPGSQRRVRAAAAAGNRLPSEEGPRRRKCRWRRWGRAGGAGGAERMDPPPPECLSFPTAPCGAVPLEGRAGSAPGRERALVPGPPTAGTSEWRGWTQGFWWGPPTQIFPELPPVMGVGGLPQAMGKGLPSTFSPHCSQPAP